MPSRKKQLKFLRSARKLLRGVASAIITLFSLFLPPFALVAFLLRGHFQLTFQVLLLTFVFFTIHSLLRFFRSEKFSSDRTFFLGYSLTLAIFVMSLFSAAATREWIVFKYALARAGTKVAVLAWVLLSPALAFLYGLTALREECKETRKKYGLITAIVLVSFFLALFVLLTHWYDATYLNFIGAAFIGFVPTLLFKWLFISGPRLTWRRIRGGIWKRLFSSAQ